MLELLPCYEGNEHGGELSPFRHLNGKMSDNDLTEFINALYDYGHDEDFKADTLEGRVKILAERDGLIIGGHLVARKGSFSIFPGCCAGLESWREWAWVKPEGTSPWLGHDPEPYVKINTDHAIICNDGHNSGGQNLKVPYDEVAVAFKQAESDFADFYTRLSDWLEVLEVKHRTEFLQNLNEDFEITKTNNPDHGIFGIAIERDTR